MMDKELRKHRFVEFFGIGIIVLSLVRCAFPGIAGSRGGASETDRPLPDANMKVVTDNSLVNEKRNEVFVYNNQKPHPIRSVHSFKEVFPDTNAVQLSAAYRWGVKPVKDRADAEKRKEELVFIGASPYYHVDPLHQSIPYLVPRAAVLLQDIGQAFYDSLYVKHIPLHQIIVTSVLRTQADVLRLRSFNGNATENSCHLYGTTVDICYNRYITIEEPEGPSRRAVRNDTLKYVLSEVLRDMRKQGRCYIKYEVKQGCFHLTVR